MARKWVWVSTAVVIVTGAAIHYKAIVRVLVGYGHICLIAPGVDLAGIIADWRAF